MTNGTIPVIPVWACCIWPCDEHQAWFPQLRAMSHPGMRISSLTKAHRHQRARWVCVCGHGRSTNDGQTVYSSVMSPTRLHDLFLATGFSKSPGEYEWSWNGADHLLIKPQSLCLAGILSHYASALATKHFYQTMWLGNKQDPRTVPSHNITTYYWDLL